MSPIRWVVAASSALVLAAGTGAVAAWARPEHDALLGFLAFGIVTLPAYLGLGVLVLSDAEPVANREDTVEAQWGSRASSGAFYDLFIALGLTTAVTAIFDLEPLDPALFLVLGMADFALRLVVLRRREA